MERYSISIKWTSNQKTHAQLGVSRYSGQKAERPVVKLVPPVDWFVYYKGFRDTVGLLYFLGVQLKIAFYTDY